MSHRKNTLLSYQTISAGAMTGTSTLTSAVTNTQFLDNIGYQFVWSGSPAGTIALQVSADYAQDLNGNVTNTGNWAPLTFTYWNGSAFVTATSIPTSAGSPVYLDLALLSAPWIRAVYTNASGTGTLTATITAKEI
jgi:hypothetical protein